MSEAGGEIALRISTAHQAGRLSDEAVEALKRVDPLSSPLALGIPASNFGGQEVLLATIMPDDSTSLNVYVRRGTSPYPSHPMLEGEGRTDSGLTHGSYEIIDVEPGDERSNAEAIRIGHNAVLDALLASPHPDNVLFATRYLNGRLLNPYGSLQAAQRLDRLNFRPDAGTPLYDQTVATLRMVLAKYEQMGADYIEPRTVTLLVTDGHDQHSRRQTDRSVAAVIKSMRNTGHHIIAAMGIDDGNTDFSRVFTDMGIDPKWILTTGSTKEEIQRAFGLFAEAASKATVITDFSKMLTAGFTGITKA